MSANTGLESIHELLVLFGSVLSLFMSDTHSGGQTKLLVIFMAQLLCILLLLTIWVCLHVAKGLQCKFFLWNPGFSSVIAHATPQHMK